MPELSVIIPTYNGAQRIRRCLEHFGQQTLSPDDFEVVVVVDGSSDDSARVLAALAPRFRLVVVEQPNQGAAAARNTGVAAALGTYCVFVDDDIVASPELLAEHLRVQRELGGVVGLGSIPTVAEAGAGWLARCVARDFAEHYTRIGSGVRAATWRDCYGGNLSVPRAAFLAAGGFASEMRRGHDVELGYRLSQLELAFVYIPAAAGTQELSKRPQELYADFEHYGRAAVAIYRRHPQTLPEVIPDFTRKSVGPVWLRRLLLAMQVPPRLAGAVGWMVGGGHRSRTWFHLIQTYCYWRGVRRGLADPESWWQLSHGTPLLAYGALAPTDRLPGSHGIPVARFARQMRWLKWTGHRVLSLDEYRCYRRAYRLPPKRAVVVVLGGERTDTRALADPVLRRCGYPETSILTAGGNGRGEAAGDRVPPPRLQPPAANTHATPPQALSRTEILETDSLPRFAWKVLRARYGAAPRAERRPSIAARQHVLETTR